MQTFSISECFSFGWERFKARPWFYVSVALVILTISLGLGIVEGIVRALLGKGLGGFVSFLISLPVNTLIGTGVTTIFLAAHANGDTPKLGDLWQPAQFVQFLYASVLVSVIVLLGLVLIIVPGVIASLALAFTQLLVIDKKLPAVEALKESARLTKGKRLQVLGLVLMVGLINLLGAIALFVGLLVTVPVSLLAMVHAYRALSGSSSPESAPVAETVSAPVMPDTIPSPAVPEEEPEA